MTIYYPVEYPMGYGQYTNIKMERSSPEQDDRGRPSPTTPGIPIATVMTVNENWRGKNDPAERRRIQNRLNQRAFRQRQRAGESPKQYRPRSGSAKADRQEDSSDDDEDEEEDDDDEEEEEEEEGSTQSESDQAAPTAEGPPTSMPEEDWSSSVTDLLITGRVWDELARIINRNFLSAAVANAQQLGLSLPALQAGTLVKTPRQTGRQIPQALTPVEAQYQVPHDPIIDVIPHARLRYNILRGIAGGQVDAADFCRRLRLTGSLEQVNGNLQRGGVVVWADPQQTSSWELSEPFVRRWYFILQNCEDLLTATNAWRGRRGERLFPLQFNSGQGSPS